MESYEIIYKDIEEVEAWEDIVKKVFHKCFEEEGLIDSKLYITVTFTNPENIQSINKEYRNIDRPTDVLSFPMFEKEELDTKIQEKNFSYQDILGDIVISIPKVEEHQK